MNQKYFTDEERRTARLAQKRASRAANPEEERAKARAYYRRNREKMIARQKGYYDANQENVRARRKASRDANREQDLAYQKAYRDAHPDIAYACHLRRDYGITLPEYVAMWEAQGRRCKLCPTELPLRHKNTHVDHCHSTGRVRGLLCQRCNTRLGYVEKRGLEGLREDLAYLGLVES